MIAAEGTATNTFETSTDVILFSFSPCLQKARRILKMSLGGGIVWSTQTTINSQKPDDLGWKGETRISKDEEEIKKIGK
jgi:hypothetical protein